MTICFFEDEGDRLFAPLTLTRPVDDLRIGIFTIQEKWQRYLNPQHISRIPRTPLTYLFPGDHPKSNNEVIWINARWLPDTEAAKSVRKLRCGEALRKSGAIVAIKLKSTQSQKHFKEGNTDFEPATVTETESGTLIGYLWDLFQQNETEIRKDVTLLEKSRTALQKMFPQAILNSEKDIYAEPGARVDPGAVIDASGGPVYLGSNSHVMYGAVIQGPSALCESSVLKIGAQMYAGTTIGPVCKVSGEIQNVIIHSHSNKAHDGFLGNSLIGEWCNLGANTTSSNLKNNYKPIKIPDWSTGNIYKSSLQFFGTVMGDHGKTAINTTLSAGTICGVFCNIFTYGFPPKHVPSFSWVSPEGTEYYQFEKAMETAEIMMNRRNIRLKQDYLKMMRHIYDKRDVMG